MSITEDYYSVFISKTDGKPIQPWEGFAFKLDHGEEYKVKLVNHHQSIVVDAKLSIDGKDIGTFTISNDGFVIIDGPRHKLDQRFVFYHLGTTGSHLGGLDRNNPHLGEVVVTFTHKTRKEPFSLSGDVETDGGTALIDRQLIDLPINLTTPPVLTTIRVLLLPTDKGPKRSTRPL